jgi:hypothetical protein
MYTDVKPFEHVAYNIVYLGLRVVSNDMTLAGVEALLSIFSCCLVSVAVLVVMKCSYS